MWGAENHISLSRLQGHDGQVTGAKGSRIPVDLCAVLLQKISLGQQERRLQASQSRGARDPAICDSAGVFQVLRLKDQMAKIILFCRRTRRIRRCVHRSQHTARFRGRRFALVHDPRRVVFKPFLGQIQRNGAAQHCANKHSRDCGDDRRRQAHQYAMFESAHGLEKGKSDADSTSSLAFEKKTYLCKT
jgi:hypothetical protein